MSVLKESQKERDVELSKILELPLEAIENIDIFNKDNIKIFDEACQKPPKNQTEYEGLYKCYKNLDIVSYIKTLMYTSVYKRGKDLQKNLDLASGNCLDFGSGVGTHSIYMIQNGCRVGVLDVPNSPLLDFTIRRLKYRGMIDKNKFIELYYSSQYLPSNFFDYVNCLDVLEHVYNPLAEIKNIYNTLKIDGILHLQVSKMIKPSSGHFQDSIIKWLNEGFDFLKSYFKEESNNIYRKVK